MVGVNLLREGVDIPEVAFVAIMDADVESFLRDKRSIIQIVGRAARNTEAKVVLYADKITKSMREAMQETERRRMLQTAYNTKHHITPTTVRRDVTKSISNLQAAIAQASEKKRGKKKQLSQKELLEKIVILETEMRLAAENLDFEKAIACREQIAELKKMLD